MKSWDNYERQVRMAKKRFLTYDQERLIRKIRLKADEKYLFVNFLCKPYRIHRETGDISVEQNGVWTEDNRYSVVMTLLDLVCDGREDRHLTGRIRSLESFGNMFHTELRDADPRALKLQQRQADFQKACVLMGARPVAGGDIGYAVELFDGLELVLLFWEGDEDFSPRLRFFWDENALQYLRYETMHFAAGLIMQEIFQIMDA